jgi:hypothetical protein
MQLPREGITSVETRSSCNLPGLAKIDPLATTLDFLNDVLAQAAIAFELRFREPLVGG